MRYACGKCGSFFKIARNGVAVEELMPGDNGLWEPYKIFLGDLYKCERCKAELIVMPSHPITEHYMPDYKSTKERFMAAGVLYRIDDCPGTYREEP